MKWRNNQRGDKRIVRNFCLFPRRIGKNSYWLETIAIEQEYVPVGGPYNTTVLAWVDSRVIQE